MQTLINEHKLDIVLVSETHCTSSSNIKFDGCHTYLTNHPDGTGHAGTAVIIRKSIKHHLMPEFKTDYLQATTVAVTDKCGYFNLSSIYCPPKHKIDQLMFNQYFSTLGQRFVAGGDWNAKHSHWGSRLVTTRGRQLKNSIDSNHLTAISASEPTYWPTDPNKVPDLLDFFIVGGLSRHYFKAESCLDSSSDHTPVFLTASTTLIEYETQLTLSNKRTDWQAFREYIEANIQLNVALKTPDNIEEAAKYITSLIQEACWKCTPELKNNNVSTNQPFQIKQQILEKRRLRRVWHLTRHPMDKTALNKASANLKAEIRRTLEETLQSKLESLTPTATTNYSLWKFTRTLDRPQVPKPPIRSSLNAWARTQQQKANAFADHLAKVFTPNESSDVDFERSVEDALCQPLQLDLPPKPTTTREVWGIMKSLKDKKAPGFDLITKEILRELPKKAVTFLTTLFNGILRVQYFPRLWKISQIIMIHKLGKPAHEVTSYRPISLLPILSKLFEKILLRRLLPILASNHTIPDHQFGFRQQHSTIEQVHRVCNEIRNAFEEKEYCSSAFLDIQQAFDRVWHSGLLYKIKRSIPHSYYLLLASYLSQRMFQAKEGSSTSSFHGIGAGVPQGSILGPLLYTIYTADLPEVPGAITATYADDTAILARNRDPVAASQTLQKGLDEISIWLNKWRIKASANKSVHVTFTLRRGNCPPVTLDSNNLTHSDSVRYLGMHLDRRMTWKNHIKSKRDELNIRYKNLYWLMGRNSKLSVDNKLLIYKSILRPSWMYGVQLWGSASDSNINILQRLQNVILRSITSVPWFVTNAEIHGNLQISTVKEEILHNTETYKRRLEHHPNNLAVQLIHARHKTRLKRHLILGPDQV